MSLIKSLFNFFAFFLIVIDMHSSFADSEPAELTIRWENYGPELTFGKLGFYPANSFLRSELYLLKFNLSGYRVSLRESSKLLSKPRGAVKDMVLSVGGVAGVNANFFDHLGEPLGLMLPSSRDTNKKVQLGGRLLTGVFSIKDGLPSVIPRIEFNQTSVSLALQAGPILYLNGAPTKFTAPSQTSRRSGLAVTKDREVVLFATLLRFPGTSLEDIQSVLNKTGLDISDALNLDGGGSSQFYLQSLGGKEEILISGGDDVPVALVVEKNVEEKIK